MMRTTITVSGIRCYAHHGCMEEEGIIGGEYVVDVAVECDLAASMLSDDLNDTVDYVMVTEVVKKEMAIRSKLIEHVGGRILTALDARITNPKQITLEIKKIAPPINADVAAAIFRVTANFGG